jgi:LCP family protein required for cell wall assembly
MGRPGIAALLSALLPGLGQAWLGFRQRGLLVAFPLLGLVAAIAGIAAANSRLLIDGLVEPSILAAILVGLFVLALYHVLAVRDAYRVGVRVAGPASARPVVLLVALVLVVGGYGSIEYLGVQTYQATTAIFVQPGTGGFQIPSASFAPTAGPTLLPGDTATPAPPPTATPVPVPQWAGDGRLNLLLIGTDAGPGRWLARTDTMIVLSVDVATHRAAMFGIPRNIVNVPLAPEDQGAFTNGRFPQFLNALYVYAIGHPSQFPGDSDADRGFRAVSGAIQELVGVPLDGAVVVNLNGFVDLVNAVGGLWIDIPHSLFDDRYPKPDGTGYITVSIQPGCQQLDGTTALEYARSRHQDDDYGRMRRQQAVLVALDRELNPIALLPQVPNLLGIAKNNLRITIPPDQFGDLAALAARVDSHAIQTIELAPPTYPEFLNTKEIKAIQARVRTIFDAATAGPSPTPSVAPKPCPRTNS